MASLAVSLLIRPITWKINHIEIYHERTRAPKEQSTEDEQTILRSELGKLMRIARIARPGEIYDDSAAEQTFSDGAFLEVLEPCGEIIENGENEVPHKRKER